MSRSVGPPCRTPAYMYVSGFVFIIPSTIVVWLREFLYSDDPPVYVTVYDFPAHFLLAAVSLALNRILSVFTGHTLCIQFAILSEAN